jgi:Subtilase family
MASAMCPNCKIILVEAINNGSGNLAASVRRAATLGAHVISNSYGGPEAGSTAFNPLYNHPGIAITASTGDCGYDNQLSSSDPNCSGLTHSANFPASSQFVTAVGGTSLHYNQATGFSETAWSGAGSGCSTVYPKPTWQAFIKLCAGRMEADVSAVADPDTGVAVYGPGNSPTSPVWSVYGGTSVAAPLVGGIYGANGGAVTLGSLYPKTIKLWDPITGSNGSCGGTYFCNAGVRYDGPTGLGTPTSEAGF